MMLVKMVTMFASESESKPFVAFLHQADSLVPVLGVGDLQDGVGPLLHVLGQLGQDGRVVGKPVEVLKDSVEGAAKDATYERGGTLPPKELLQLWLVQEQGP